MTHPESTPLTELDDETMEELRITIKITSHPGADFNVWEDERPTDPSYDVSINPICSDPDTDSMYDPESGITCTPAFRAAHSDIRDELKSMQSFQEFLSELKKITSVGAETHYTTYLRSIGHCRYDPDADTQLHWEIGDDFADPDRFEIIQAR